MKNVDLNVPRFIFVDGKGSARFVIDVSAFFTRTCEISDTSTHANTAADEHNNSDEEGDFTCDVHDTVKCLFVIKVSQQRYWA